MDHYKPTALSFSRIVVRWAVVLCFFLPFVSYGQNSSLASRELAQRSDNTGKAQELLKKGDESYMAGRFSEAVDAYQNAHRLLPAAPLTWELRSAAADRYAQAAVEQAKLLSRKGDVEGAKSLLDKVLSPDVAPAHEAARIARKQLDNPIRTNPALTAEHVRKVDEVRRTLYIAQGAYDLGKFDESKENYEKVLRIDPTNSAARRGLEKVAAAKSQHYQSSFDHTRAEMLKEVASAWETTVPPEEIPALPAQNGQLFPADATITARLNQLILPRVDFDGVTIYEAVDFLRSKTRELSGEAQQPINFTINLGPSDSPEAKEIGERRFNLHLKEIPVSRALRYITEATSTSFTVDDFSVIISSASFTTDEMITRTFRVPPDFLTTINAGLESSTPKNNDPFSASSSDDKGLLIERLGAKEALEKQGVAFPTGSSAFYSPAVNSLRVTNTATNLDFITQILESLTQADPVMVSVRVTMIRTEKTNLDELGFDWLVNPFGASANHLFASGGTTGNGIIRTGADMVSPANGTSVDGIPADPQAATTGMLTNGLRSGDHAIGSNTIDALINNPDRTGQVNSVAPGIAGITGLFSDGQVQVLLRGLAQKKNVDVMVSPSVLTRSGQATSIHLVREFNYPTEYEPPEIPNSVGANSGRGFPVVPATPTAFQKRDVGVVLEVVPTADPQKRYVDVALNPSFSEFDGFVNYGSPINATTTDALGNQITAAITSNRILQPIFSDKRVNTQLNVLDGSTIAFGELMQDEIQDVNDKVPILGDLPLIGRLFQSKARQQTSTALIFLVRVELLDPTGRPYRQH